MHEWLMEGTSSSNSMGSHSKLLGKGEGVWGDRPVREGKMAVIGTAEAGNKGSGSRNS